MRFLMFSSLSALALGLIAMPQASAESPGTQELLVRPAVQARAPLSSVFLDVTYAGERLVAVGERGIVLISDDDGKAWRQVKVPASVTLTRVRFPSPMMGWAVGHYGTVLHTADGGETWVRQLDGTAVARLALAAVEAQVRAAPEDGNAKRRLIEAERLVKDGPDKPFLDLHFFDDKRGFIVGAFNLIFETEDGGKTWRSSLDRLDNPKSLHLYAIAGSGETLYVAGERGLVFRSDDGGRTFTRVNTPYVGSYFAVSVPRPGEVILAGLRGNVFRSKNGGATWEKVEGAPPVSFSVVTRLAGQAVLMANQAGQLFMSRGGPLELMPTPALPPFAAVLPLRDGSLLGVGVRGVMRVALSKKIGR